MQFVAVILAAGHGQRFGNKSLPKQYESIAGKPVFIHSINLYRRLDSVAALVLVTNPKLIDETNELLDRFGCADGVTVVSGGATRRDSITNGMNWLVDNRSIAPDDRIILHNAASPNTAEDLVRKCIDAAESVDAVQAYMPELRTVFTMDSDTVSNVLRRDQLAVSCDPTIYRFQVLCEAMDRQHEYDLAGDATIDIVHALGYAIKLIRSGQDNIKITTQWDLSAVAQAMDTRVQRR